MSATALYPDLERLDAFRAELIAADLYVGKSCHLLATSITEVFNCHSGFS
jgi:hypothetical protein